MPTKTKKSNHKTNSGKPGINVFAGDSHFLQLLLIAFMALSSLLVLQIISQQDELDLVKGVKAITETSK